MAKKAAGPVDPLKAKEAKQKKIAIIGGVLLVIVLGVQGPKLMKQMHQSTAPPPPPPASSTATPAVTTDPGSPTFTTAAPAGGSPSDGLASNAPTAAIGQLSSFGTFVGKDPFASQAPTGPVSAPSGGKTPPKTPPTPPTPPSPPTATTPAANPTSAVIAVNGAQETVAVGADFPTKQPFFHLVSLTQHTAKISIAGGSLASGAGSITLQEKKPLTLQNTNDGTRYTLELFPQGTALTQTGTTATGGASAFPPAGPSGTTGTTTGSTTSTVTTTTTG